MSAVASRSIFLLGILLLIFLATLLASSGTARGAGFTVDSPADVADANPGDGVCDSGSGDCTLRAAIEEANALAGTDTITLLANTYTLTLGTELTISTDLILNGAGSGDTIIQAATSSADATSRVFNITGGTVAISGVTIQNGKPSDAGGGILNSGSLTLTNTTVTDNTGSSGGGIYNFWTLTLSNSTISGNKSNFDGGGIYNGEGTVTLTDSTVRDNSGTFGGGIRNTAILILTNSTIIGNTAYSGGGISNSFSGTVFVTSSTITSNTAGEDAGGILNSSGPLTLTNSTVSGNSAGDDGGGIYSGNFGTVTLTNSTVSGNTATDGGGIYIFMGTAELTNTIVALNLAGSGSDCFGSPTSLGYNLIGDDSGCGYTAVTGDLVGDGTNPIDPLLGPLQDNGGPTFTHALLDRSPAIDQISTELCVVATDQRGVIRPQGPACDIGSYELVPTVEATHFGARLNGHEEVPPVVTDAWGVFRARLDETGTELEYVLLVGKIRGVTAAHIHCAPFGEVGPIGVTLYEGGPVDIGRGTLASGAITGPDVGNWCGWTTLDDVLEGLRSGDTYVNVHTETWPGGEIRGQIVAK